MVVSARVQPDAVLTTGRENWMRDCDLAMCEHDHRYVLEWDECCLLLLDREREVLAS